MGIENQKERERERETMCDLLSVKKNTKEKENWSKKSALASFSFKITCPPSVCPIKYIDSLYQDKELSFSISENFTHTSHCSLI